MRIGRANTAERVLVVAEIGNNHEGRPEIAGELVRQAAAAGADAVKFQTYRVDKFISQGDPARLQRLTRFCLSPEQFRHLSEQARGEGLLFMSTPLDLDSLEVLIPIVDGLKIASGDNQFYELIRRAAETQLPVIVSSGLIDLSAVQHTLGFLRSHRPIGLADEVAVLHCVSAYPVSAGEANLGAIRTLCDTLDVTVGYSDHTIGIDACVLAVAAGARIVEKHFTLDKGFSEFRDHALSADPSDLREMVSRIRQAEILMGSGEKRAQPLEEAGRIAMRRSIVAARPMRAGTAISADDLMWTRPGGGLAPGEEHRLLGRVLRVDLDAGALVLPTHVE